MDLIMLTRRLIIFVFLDIKFGLRVQGNCGGSLKGPTGFFQSPNKSQLVHQLNRSAYECKWTITLPSGSIKLEFTQFSVGYEHSLGSCDPQMSVKIIDYSINAVGKLFCGSKTPPVYYSKSSSIEVILKAHLTDPTSSFNTFKAVYSTLYVTPTPDIKATCGPCGGHLNQDSGMIRSPNYPNAYPYNCDCKWTIYARREYNIKLKFWSFSLEKEDTTNLCHDYLSVYDGASSSSPSLGKFCGNTSPGSLQTSKTEAFVHFHSDFSTSGDGFEIMFQSIKDTKDLNSLRSIAAILGGVSFGIFIFLLLCSVIYKKYISNDDNRDTCPSQNAGENDYLDAVQAAAPPSYQAVMADPEHYPRTPEITPSPSPVVTPSLLRRNLVRPLPFIHDASHHLDSLEEDEDDVATTPPPPYPGNVKEPSEVDILIADFPPPPTYEMVSDSDELSDSPATWDPIDHHEQPRVSLPEVTVIQNASVSSTPSCTGHGCCEFNGDGHVSLDNRGGEVVSTYWIRATGDNGDSPSTSHRGPGISRHRSDSALRGQLISRTLAEGTSQADSSPVRRRKLSDSGAKSNSTRDLVGGGHSRSNRKKKHRMTQTDRSCSTPSVLQNPEDNTRTDCQQFGDQTGHNSIPGRSLFTRHSHFVNRIRPDSTDSQHQISGNNSPRTTTSRNSNRSQLHVMIDTPEGSS